MINYTYFQNLNMGQLWSALSFLVLGGNWANIQSRQLDQRKLEQDRIISEIRSIENCMYCYLDKRIETLLLPWANREFQWDLNPEILSTFRERPQNQTKSCHCEAVYTSSESLSNFSYDLSTTEGLTLPLLTDTENTDYSNYEISEDE